MFYIHQTNCISPQLTLGHINLDDLKISVDNTLRAIEPSYDAIPPAMYRRMGKAVRLASGAALPLLHNSIFNGIVVGTANGGMEDCIKFLNQIIEYEEGKLTPTNFVQSTTNAIASQLAFFSSNKGHNSTHVHRGLAFENALLDVDMLLKEHPKNCYLAGGVDEISTYNYNIDSLGGWYKKENILNTDLYKIESSGSIAGEGCAMFTLNNVKEGATAKVKAISTIHSDNEEEVKQHLQFFLAYNLKGETLDLLISGENGDNRFILFYNACETILPPEVTIARFKHMSGEYPTAVSFALWFACQVIETQHLPKHSIKKQVITTFFKNILIYNCYHGTQHSFILVSACE